MSKLVLGRGLVEDVVDRRRVHCGLLGRLLGLFPLSLDGFRDVFLVTAREGFFCLCVRHVGHGGSYFVKRRVMSFPNARFRTKIRLIMITKVVKTTDV